MFRIEKARGIYFQKCSACGQLGMRMMLKIKSSHYPTGSTMAKTTPNPDVYVHADCFITELVKEN